MWELEIVGPRASTSQEIEPNTQFWLKQLAVKVAKNSTIAVFVNKSVITSANSLESPNNIDTEAHS